ncbi:GGDEF domain-containing protein [Candidatus Nomurabacteria bacterium]|nr:GGDEF domain-containing protein [Candidatus Nomurabacteria bacterium]
MNHELSDSTVENNSRIRRIAGQLGGFLIKHTSCARQFIAQKISPELASEAALASVDPSTGLPNRRAMQRRYEELSESNLPFAVIMVDLDNFKLLNEQVGHENADEIMNQFAQCLSSCTRQTDELSYIGEAYRTGGDEFVLLAPLIPNPKSNEDLKSDETLTPENRLNALLDRLSEECFSGVDLYDKSGQKVNISATYSAELINPGQNTESDVVLNGLSKYITANKKDRRLTELS